MLNSYNRSQKQIDYITEKLPKKNTKEENYKIKGEQVNNIVKVEKEKDKKEREVEKKDLKIDKGGIKKNQFQYNTEKMDEQNKFKTNKNDYFQKINKPNSIPENLETNRGIMGLKNIGNTCFMNSSLQCLSHIKILYKKLKNEKNLGKLSSSFKKFMEIMHENIPTTDKFEPKEIFDIMSKNFPKYKSKRQQGANEFINNFLMILHDELNSHSHNKKKFDTPTNPIIKNKFIKKEKYYDNNRPIIIDLFYGNTALLSKCKRAHTINAIFSVFNILELSIYRDKEKKEIKLEDLIKSNFSDKDEGDLGICPTCNKLQEVPIKTQNKIIHTPDILIIYINKVIDNYYYNNKIIFPFELDLSKELGYKKNEKFELKGFINHIGSEYSGHYSAICKNFHDDNWYECNDEIVEFIEELSNESENVMILFYERIGLD
jgi:ubiquitin C-terminal hydrolase